MTDRQFWLIIYRALMSVAAAIKARYLGDVDLEAHPGG